MPSKKMIKLFQHLIRKPESKIYKYHKDIAAALQQKLEEVILVKMLAENIGALKHKPLSYWVDKNVGKCYSADVKKQNDEYIKKLNEGNKSV
jgi:predicted NodU family carbamoyl transferase